MIDLKELLHRFEELEKKLADSVSIKDIDKYVQLIKEYNFLKPIIIKIKEIDSIHKEVFNYIDLIRTLSDELEIQEYINEIRNLRSTRHETFLSLNKLFSEYRKAITDRKEDNPIVDDPKPYNSKKANKDFEESIKKIRGKDWDLIKEKLIEFIPIITEPGLPPSEDLGEMAEFAPLFKEIINEENVASQTDRINIIFEKKISKISNELCFRNGLYIFHKASHIVSSAELHAELGLKSYSLSGAYQGAFLAAKSILSMLGLTFVEAGKNTFLIDFWHSPQADDDSINVGIIRFGYVIGHRHVWQLFVRVLKTFAVNVWEKTLINKLLSYDEKDYSKQRNEINYWGNKWIFDDLHEFDKDLNFAVYLENLEGGLKEFEMKSDFSLVISQLLLNMAFKMIRSISEKTNALKLEISLIESFLQKNERHPIYIKNTF